MAPISRGPGAPGQLPLNVAPGQTLRHPAIPGPHMLFGPPPEPPGKQEAHVQAGRLAAIDALRGIAMLLGVFIHAAISYLPTSLTKLVWGIREETTSPVLGVLFWWIHTFRLPLFFVIAGFFTLLVYDTKGPRAFIVHRVRRLLIPFAVGLVIMLPLSYLFYWSCGVVNHRVADVDIQSFEIEPRVLANLFGPMHLWFLQDLLVMSLVAWALWRLMDRMGLSRGGVKPWPTWVSALAPVLLAIPAALILWFDCAPVIAHRNTFVPHVGRLLYYGLFFACGAALYQHRKALPRVFAWPGLHLGLSLAAAVGLLALLPARLGGHPSAVDRLAFAGCAALVAWLSVFGFMGLALRYIQGQHPLAHYMADASYWIYLVHLPLVCLLQLDLFGLPLGPELKCALVVAIAAALGLATYHTMVRYTIIGTCLHGPRARAKAD